MEADYVEQGDCLELMKDVPDGSVDLVLTDPPYNISVKNNFKTMGRNGIDFGEWDKNADITSFITHLERVTNKNASVIIFNAWRNLGQIADELEANGFVVKDVIRWRKLNPMPRNRDRRYIVDYEFAIWGVKKGANWTFQRQSDKYDRPEVCYSIVGGSEKTCHPTQKPVALMGELIRRHSREGDVVLDPFMGSGSTCVAAVNTGRHYIGFELDPNYFEIACKRLDEVENVSA